MPTRLHPTQAIELINKAVTGSATEQLKVLLETKHLYQRVSFDPSEKIANLCADFTYSDHPARVPAYLKELPSVRLEMGAETAIHAPVYRGEPIGETITTPGIGFVNLKMFCSACKSREAFTATWMRDVDRDTENTGRFRTTPARIARVGEVVQQNFCVAYLCMACSSEMVLVTIARRGWHLSLEGRSPLEIVDTPSYVPKKERHLFAEATVARNVGRLLAAIFFLRTFIEKFARRQTALLDTKVSGEELMDAYSKTLPDQYRDLLPSLKFWYGKLSVAIHTADADEKLLEEAWSEIEKHFKVRDAFNLNL